MDVRLLSPFPRADLIREMAAVDSRSLVGLAIIRARALSRAFRAKVFPRAAHCFSRMPR